MVSGMFHEWHCNIKAETAICWTKKSRKEFYRFGKGISTADRVTLKIKFPRCYLQYFKNNLSVFKNLSEQSWEVFYCKLAQAGRENEYYSWWKFSACALKNWIGRVKQLQKSDFMQNFLLTFILKFLSQVCCEKQLFSKMWILFLESLMHTKQVD